MTLARRPLAQLESCIRRVSRPLIDRLAYHFASPSASTCPFDFRNHLKALVNWFFELTDEHIVTKDAMAWFLPSCFEGSCLCFLSVTSAIG